MWVYETGRDDESRHIYDASTPNPALCRCADKDYPVVTYPYVEHTGLAPGTIDYLAAFEKYIHKHRLIGVLPIRV
jgi:hypothetical protein